MSACFATKAQLYAYCPMHSYQDSAGNRKNCIKFIQINKPTEEIVRRRLKWWLLRGFMLTRNEGEGDEELRRRHVEEDPPWEEEDLGSDKDLETAIEYYFWQMYSAE